MVIKVCAELAVDSGKVLRKLILVKHAVPQIIPTLPAHAWHLSADGQQPCLPLARLLAPYCPATIVSSREPKAAETAAYIAAHLHTSWRLGEGLHEHDRANVGYLSKEHFGKSILRPPLLPSSPIPLKLPSFGVLTLPEFGLEEVVADIA